jgi:hypothetical protein
MPKYEIEQHEIHVSVVSPFCVDDGDFLLGRAGPGSGPTAGPHRRRAVRCRLRG